MNELDIRTKVWLRIPKRQKWEMEHLAACSNQSLNSLMITVIDEYIGRHEAEHGELEVNLLGQVYKKRD